MDTSHYIHLIDPVLLELGGPAAIRWYGLAYLAGFFAAYVLLIRWVRQGSLRLPSEDVQTLLFYCVIGVMVGGRLGFLIFYDFAHWRADPLLIVRIWQGGMASHGGMIGLAVAMVVFARSRQLSFLEVSDAICTVGPIGVFFGRIANFINGELYGRVTDVRWAVYFPTERPELHPGGSWAAHRYDLDVIREFIQQGLIQPRHPAQLYAAVIEGLVVFLILWSLHRAGWWRWPGRLTVLFLSSYAVGRILVEGFREPEIVHGGVVTQGQLLSLLMIVVAGLIWKFLMPSASGAISESDSFSQKAGRQSKGRAGKRRN